MYSMLVWKSRVRSGVLLTLGVLAPAASASVEVVPIARSGDLSPDGDGTFGSFLDYGPPGLNDAHQVIFSADLSGNAGGGADDELLVRAESDRSLTILAREGASIPGGTGAYDNLKTPSRRYVMNNDGRAGFVCEMTGTPGGTADNQAIYSSDGPGTETIHARTGDPAAGTSSTFVGLFPPTINHLSPVRVSFYAHVGGAGAHPAYIYTNSGGSSTLIAKITDPVPGDGGTLLQFDESQPASLEPFGDAVAFRAQLTGTPFGSEDDAAIYKGRGAGLIQVARGREPVPGGGANYDEFYDPVLNALGNVAFRVVLRPTSLGEAIVIQGGDLDADLVVISNQLHPDRVSKFDRFYAPALSAGNVAAFRALLKETPGGGFDDEGIYRGDGTILMEVAREGQSVPEGGGTFANFGSHVGINAQGQVLFYATLRDTPFGASDNAGLYLWDESAGTTKLVRERDVVPGGAMVTGIQALSATDTGGFRSLNDASEAVAILDTSSPERDGVYLFRMTDTSNVHPHGDRFTATLLAFPNPWTEGALSVRCATKTGSAPSSVEIVSTDGRRVATLRANGGIANWDGHEDSGETVPSGVYFIRIPGSSVPSSRVVRLIR